VAKRGYLFVLAASVTGATSAVAIRAILGSLPIAAMSLAFWREFLTFLTLLLGLTLIRPSLLRIKKRDLGLLAAAGLVGLGPFHLLWVIAVSRISLATATILHYTFPAFVVLLSYVIWREAITRRKVYALVLTFVGIVFVARPFQTSLPSPPLSALGGNDWTDAGLDYPALWPLSDRPEFSAGQRRRDRHVLRGGRGDAIWLSDLR
jgi:drug/metabolite transporter (DMT)-like permease